MEAVEERVNVAKVEEAVVTETVQQGVREELVSLIIKCKVHRINLPYASGEHSCEVPGE